MAVRLSVAEERFPVAGAFTISRGSRTEIRVVTATLSDGGFSGRGECVPYPRYGETAESVIALVRSVAIDLDNGLDRIALQVRLPPGAARNALDCAFWDLEAKRTATPAWRLAGLAEPRPRADRLHDFARRAGSDARAGGPERRPAAAQDQARLPTAIFERVQAVRAGAPNATTHRRRQRRLDARADTRPSRPSWRDWASRSSSSRCPPPTTPRSQASSARCRFAPTKAAMGWNRCRSLRASTTPSTSSSTRPAGSPRRCGSSAQAEAEGFRIMVGCMLGTSLAMAPAFLLTDGVDFIDLDGPLLLAKDRKRRSATSAR